MKVQVKHSTVSRVISEFSLEYRTTRDRVIQTIQKKKEARAKKRMARAQAAEAEALQAARAALKSTKDDKEGGNGELSTFNSWS